MVGVNRWGRIGELLTVAYHLGHIISHTNLLHSQTVHILYVLLLFWFFSNGFADLCPACASVQSHALELPSLPVPTVVALDNLRRMILLLLLLLVCCRCRRHVCHAFCANVCNFQKTWHPSLACHITYMCGAGKTWRKGLKCPCPCVW